MMDWKLGRSPRYSRRCCRR
jgi:hypothetical protein